MKKIFCIGETVLDIIFKSRHPVAARPGGSMLNTAVSLGRTGLFPVFITDFGQDPAGDLIHSFLQENKIDTRYVNRFPDGNTGISLAFLDPAGDASYSFYRKFPVNRLQIRLPEAKKGDVVLFGSFFAIDHDVRKPLWAFLMKARANGAFLLYDPNFRKPYMKQLPEFRPWILENINIAQITRGSAEDFLHIFEVPDARGTFREIRDHGGDTLIYTKSNRGVEVLTNTLHLHLVVPEISPVSTIGAGDAFNAGLIWALFNLSHGARMPATEEEWKTVISTAIAFSTDVCMSLDNYIDRDFVKQLSHA